MAETMIPNVFDDLLHEERTFPPPESFRQHAIIHDVSIYERARKDPVAYWESEARELEWMKPWTQAMVWNPPHVQWFVGGKMNITVNCLDRHLKTARRNKAALIWEGEDSDIHTLTYHQLHQKVCIFANALKRLGIEKGDRVAIYLPMMEEAIISMLACARIGAIHSVVFGGFSPDSLADRINDAKCKLLITADGGWRRGNIVPLKQNADQALERCPSVQQVIICKRPHGEPFHCHVKEGRDHWYHRLVEHGDANCPPEPMDSEDPLYILYTSGTTGKPKGIVHTCGGYAVGVHTTTQYVFDLQEEDTYWCTADIGWVTGHSYVVYGPLQCGATVFTYEGAPDYPHRDRFWDMIERHRVSVFYTAPTAIRSFMKWGSDLPAKHDMSSLRLLGTVGEPINPEAWMWYHENIGGGRCPVVDTWWQTETGAIMISGLPGVSTMHPGYAGRPLPGIDAVVLDEQGNEIQHGSGLLALRHPWPAIARTIWGDDERYVQTYFSKWNSRLYFPGDGAKCDAEGNFMILGRVDDVLNVAAHRIGTMEVESALVDHPSVAEAAVIGRAHDIKGQAIVAFVTLKSGVASTQDLLADLKEHVVQKIGAIARPEEIYFTGDLPKTRSGKIMRRLLRDIAEGRALGDTTTLADPNVVADLREMYEEKYGG